jgi:hypothetical protein
MPTHPRTLTVFFIACFLLNACSSASPASVIPTGTLVELIIPSRTPSQTPSNTPTPKPTEIPASPTPKVRLAGLVAELSQIQPISPEEAQLRIQKAIDTVTVAAPTDNVKRVQVGQFPINDRLKGKFIRVIANQDSSLSSKIVDTFKTTIQTDIGPVEVTQVVYALWVKHIDGKGVVTEGQVVFPVVYDEQAFSPGGIDISEIQFRLHKASNLKDNGQVDFRFLVELSNNSTKPDNPVMIALYDKLQNNPEAKDLLKRANELAKKGYFLTQDEINYLYGLLMYW